ncbi:Polynucleotide adenylyltransferase region [Denitrovibrio acetiphilus DSM 12809]|uniref:Polynucleotide adenylyltransferase region n=1 Tax=Denitrovibrio acetiphilus (strain DSM 12809 / NBRC 114555 / N2460) TaxID=522772 RepID=D4H8E9_DENA2|nr:CBS domain-containing protein [Denitrovibrio acetiphilus]ADD68298.1 Polynucleotide adenylyltransferase region [Denitrovibrio acetiphilus DSM 12809]
MNKKIAITHKNPDFDALASAYAAVLLYGLDSIVTATSYETSVKEYMTTEDINLPLVHYKEKDIENIDRLELLVITDCKLENRLEPLQSLIKKADKVIIYDHHPAHGEDIQADEKYIEEIGACTSMLVHLLKDKNINVTPVDASLLIAGIYEDTGMLTFTSTTVRDMEAAAWLLARGADLQMISDYVKREMSRDHVFMLNELLTNMSLVRIGAISIGLSDASSDQYVGEISYLAHKIMDIESLDALFILVRTGDRVVLVGRSRADEVNAATIAYHFGGGGHPTAASAVIKQQTLHEANSKLNLILHEVVKPVKMAGDIMNFPVKSLSVDTTFAQAIDMFMKHNLNMMPVVDGLKPVGMVSRKDILQGLKHELNNEPINSIMQVEFGSVEPDAPYYAVEELMLGSNQKMIIVQQSEELKGVITRTDLLRLMHEEISKMPRYQDGRLVKNEVKRFKNISSSVMSVMPDRVVDLLHDIGRMGDEQGFKCYLVGGVVRDILLRKNNEDIDIVVEGSAPAFAKKFAAKHNARVAVHAKFKTAVVIFPDGFRVDFATSRTEYYNFPASAPTVEDASIRNDLFRRDFSINAMAVKLNNSEFGTLLDFFGGQRDISDRKIRVLHSLSFVDDPSRALRAIRFAVRFDFSIGPHTDRLFKHAVSLNLFDRVIGPRMFLELKYILNEKNYTKALDMMKKYDMIRFFSKKVQMDDRKTALFEGLELILDWYSFQFEDEFELYVSRFIVLFWELDREDIGDLLDRFQLDDGKTKELLNNYIETKDVVNAVSRRNVNRPSYFTQFMDRLSTPCAVAASAVLGEQFEPYVKDYFTDYRFVKADIDGNDLKEAGVKPLMIYSKILSSLKNEKIDGKCLGRDAQMKRALVLAKELVKNG